MPTRLDISKLTLMDALDLATLIEVEAQKRYTQFAEQLGTRDADDAGAVFASMGVNESKHGEQLADAGLRCSALSPRRSSSTTSSTWRPPTSARRTGTWPRWMRTRWRCLRKKAFAFYDQALRYVKQPTSRRCSRTAGREAEHVRMVEESSRSCRRRLRSTSRTWTPTQATQASERTAWIPDAS